MPPPSLPQLLFYDRTEAGRTLALSVADLHGGDPLVLGVPGGGVVVAAEVARPLSAPLDVWTVAKIEAPHRSQRPLGAVAEGGEVLLEDEALFEAGVSVESVLPVVSETMIEVVERSARLRCGRSRPSVAGRAVVVVDDGIESGVTAKAALRALKHQGAEHVLLAVPVGAADAVDRLRSEAHAVVCLTRTHCVRDTGAWYQEFPHVTDAEVAEVLAAARR